jgi:sec-independent protein translocase protein TatB
MIINAALAAHERFICYILERIEEFMFGIGLPEMILILALALIVVGPDKLPELARSIAKGVLELKKTVSTLKEEFADENPFDSVKPELEEVASSLKDQLGEQTPDGWDKILEDDPLKPNEVMDPLEAAPADALTESDAGDTASTAGENTDPAEPIDQEQESGQGSETEPGPSGPDSKTEPAAETEDQQPAGDADGETPVDKTAT